VRIQPTVVQTRPAASVYSALQGERPGPTTRLPAPRLIRPRFLDVDSDELARS
jgi:hypothetical protein